MIGLRVADWLAGLDDFFRRGSPFGARRARRDDLRRAYRSQPSFSDLLPWLDFVDDDFVLLEDGCSLGAMLELRPEDVEGKSERFMETLREKLMRALTDSFDESVREPWVLQLFAFADERGLRRRWRTLQDYRRDSAPNDDWREAMETLMREHIKEVSRPQGLFVDPLSERKWSGSHRRVLACVYRRYISEPNEAARREELLAQLGRLEAQLSVAGIGLSRLSAAEATEFLGAWLSPGGGALSFDDHAPFDYCLADAVSSPDVRSDAARGVWHFDGLAHRVLTLQRLRATPSPGQLSAERVDGRVAHCFLEQLPPRAILAMTFVFISQDLVGAHLDRVERAAVGESVASESGRGAVRANRRRLLSGDKLYPFSLAVYLRADDADALDKQSADVEALCLGDRLQMISPALDPVRLDAYLRHLPMGYRYALDQLRLRSRFIYASDAAALLPLYGRALGSDRAGLVFFNRGGDLFSCDPLSLDDRTKNAHLFLLGPTGSGKSATLVYLQMLMMAFHRPRIIAVEAGNSFGLLSQFFRSKGLRTHDVTLRPGCGTSLPPFASASALIDADAAGESRERDLLGEMTLIARIMVTGGAGREEERFSRADEALLRQALLDAAKAAAGSLVRVSDLRRALQRRAADSAAPRALRLNDMAEALGLFTTGFSGELFDGDGRPWPDVDYLRLEMGVLAGEQYRDQLSVAWLGLINQVIAMAQRASSDGRPTILLTDEAHVITGNPLLASYIVKISKLLGRRLGLWLWMATQNIGDFRDDAEKMLAMFEWWLCLHIGKGELREMERFRALDEEQRLMLLDTRKAPGLYTEGVLLSDSVQGRVRNVPPALCLALAQTEKEERSARERLRAERGCSELEAALIVAEDIAGRRRA